MAKPITKLPSEPIQMKKKPRGTALPTYKDARAVLDKLMQKQGGKFVAEYKYHDDEGKHVASVLRYNLPTDEGKKPSKTFRPISRWDDGWRLCDPPGKWPLYKLPVLADAKVVYVVEGEKCVKRLIKAGFVATTSAHGAGSPHKTDWLPLKGKKVVIVRDQDNAGEKYQNVVSKILEDLNRG
jgi:putative DNA primase/helicase